MKVILAGAGAFGVKHLEAIAKIDGIEVVSLVGREAASTREVAQKFGIGHVSTESGREPGAAGCRGGAARNADAAARRTGGAVPAKQANTS